jgi:hypothetical protein
MVIAMTMPRTEPDPKQLESVRTLVERARAGLLDERREGRRFPFFQPVVVSGDQAESVSFSAFSRDVSAWGIGLLCFWPLRLRPVQMKVFFQDEEAVELKGYVQWCHPCGQGWYAAGVSFQEGECDDITYAVGGYTG